jgi:hypothetical protein
MLNEFGFLAEGHNVFIIRNFAAGERGSIFFVAIKVLGRNTLVSCMEVW